MSTNANFELRLVDALKPIRAFALAQGIYHLFESGIFEQIDRGDLPIHSLAKSLNMRPDRLEGFLRFLANEDLVSLEGGTVSLTERGQNLRDFRPWYELLIGGYAQTFQQITEVLSGKKYASRDGRMVSIGSCGISQYDALPLVRELLSDMSTSPSELIDIGCGDGRFLIDIMRDYPEVPAVGVDPFAPAEKRRGRLRFEQLSAIDYLHTLRFDSNGVTSPPRLFIAAFLLQEVLEQSGRAVVVDMVRTIIQGGAYLAIIEVDAEPENPAILRSGLGLAYYNPYYLVHVLTEQRLESLDFWLHLFDEAGASVVSRRAVNPDVDSTGLLFGCLLRAT